MKPNLDNTLSGIDFSETHVTSFAPYRPNGHVQIVHKNGQVETLTESLLDLPRCRLPGLQTIHTIGLQVAPVCQADFPQKRLLSTQPAGLQFVGPPFDLFVTSFVYKALQEAPMTFELLR